VAGAFANRHPLRRHAGPAPGARRGVRWGVLATNPAKRAGRNPAPKRAEIEPFTSDELEWLAAELGPWGSVVQFAAATGLRPAEWIALERPDVRRDERVVIVERSFSRGVLRPDGKTARSRRRVPLSRAALDALALQPLRIDTQLVFPAREGGHLDLHNWRSREWIPAVEAAGLRRGRRVYDLRHTFATNALAAGISLYELARFMGTSARMIDQTYGHLAHGAENAAWEKLDAFADRAR
jgi:integrase